MNANPTVFIVDDDEAMRDSLTFMFRQADLEVEAFSSADAFLKSFDAAKTGCLVLDLRMPNGTGAELQEHLNKRGIALPVIFLTGHGDVPTAVERMKAGATDFLIKPVNREVLLSRVNTAIEIDRERRSRVGEVDQIRARVGTLSPRELEVMDLVAQGEASKIIAAALKVSYKTVTHHRDHILKKMRADNTADLVRMLGLIGRISSHEKQ